MFVDDLEDLTARELKMPLPHCGPIHADETDNPHKFCPINGTPCPSLHKSTWLHTAEPFPRHLVHPSGKETRLVSMTPSEDELGQNML